MSLSRKVYLILFIGVFAGLISSCASKTVSSVSDEVSCFNQDGSRNPANQSCNQLFDNDNGLENRIGRPVSLRITETRSSEPESNKQKIQKELQSQLKLVTNIFVPHSSDAFWEVVSQLAANGNSKVTISDSEFVLTQNVDATTKIHARYTYDVHSNEFIISKIEYTDVTQQKKAVEGNPNYSVAENLRRGLFTNLPNVEGPTGREIKLLDKVDYALYEEVAAEIPRLKNFTTYEILKLSKLPSKVRAVKFAALSKARTFKNEIMNYIIKDYIIGGSKTILISFASVIAISNSGMVTSFIKKEVPTPVWVAPAVVKMAADYPEPMRPELVRLMKNIEAQSKMKAEDLDKIKSLDKKNEKLVSIDETDQFSIKYDPEAKKTYFMMTHEKEAGGLDAYAAEINPRYYPELVQYYKDAGQ